MTDSLHSHPDADLALRTERRWGMVSITIVVLMVVLATVAGLNQGVMPQRQVETIDPTTLHITGEFVEANLGSAVEPDGSVTVRLVGQQYSFTPDCILVPAGTPITFRATSADVVHGFLIQRTNINMMLVPGYIAVLPARFDRPGDHLMPCHEYCSFGHEGMWAKVKVVDKAEFLSLAANRRRLSCAE